MYAVVRTGGKQVRCEPGSSIQVEKLAGEELERFAAHRINLTEQFAALGEADSPTMLACVDGEPVEGRATC